MEQLSKDYGDNVRVVQKNFVVHPQVATDPALALCAGGKQGKYKEMEQALWEKGYDANRNYAKDNIDAIATGVGLDLNKMHADMAGECQKALQTDQSMLAQVGVSGTPAFYINGRFLSGARPIEQFKAIVDEEIKKADDQIGKDGVTVQNYYDNVVVGKGKKKLEMAQ